MGLGSTAKKLQKVADMAEDVYKRLNEVREQVHEMQQTVRETRERVDRLESENAEQRALLEAIAEEQGLDLDAVTAQVHIGEAEATSANESTDATPNGDSASTSESGE
ncbi:MAG: DUF5798 family protein [Halobacteriota archaeon]